MTRAPDRSRAERPFEILELKAVCRAKFADEVVKDLELDLGKDAHSFKVSIETTLLEGIREMFLTAPIDDAISQTLRRALLTFGQIDSSNVFKAEALISEAVAAALRGQLGGAQTED